MTPISSIWLKGIVEQTVYRRLLKNTKQISKKKQKISPLESFFVSKSFLILCQMFWPWCSLWWPGAGPLRYWTILNSYSVNVRLFCVTMEVHRYVCLKIKSSRNEL